MTEKKKSAIREHYEAANRQLSSPATIQDVIESHELLNARAVARNPTSDDDAAPRSAAKKAAKKSKR